MTTVPDRSGGDVSGFRKITPHHQRHQRAARPYGGWFDSAVDRLTSLAPTWNEEVNTEQDELTLYVAREQLVELARLLRDDAVLRFETCVSVSAVHYPDEPGAEFHIVYQLLSMTHNRRITLEVAVGEDDPLVDSLTGVYPHVDWHEREAWDMFGIQFVGHPHLTRILMPDDWDGHPQRKDYPLGGVPLEFKGARVPPPDQRRSY